MKVETPGREQSRNQQGNPQPRENANQPQPAPRDVEQAAAVAQAVSNTEMAEPRRISDAGVRVASARIMFYNVTDQPIRLRIPELVEMDPHTHSAFEAGYHRAIHRQSPQIMCEEGENCQIGFGTRGDRTISQYVEAMKPVKMGVEDRR